MVQTVKDVVEALGGRIAVANAFGMTRQAVHIWCGNNLFPAHLRGDIEHMATLRGILVPLSLFPPSRRKKRRSKGELHAEAPEG